MGTIVGADKRKRRILGTAIWWMFLAFNAFMGVWFCYALTVASETRGEGTDAVAQAAAAITAGVLLWLWPIGSVILGLIVALTRRKTVKATATHNRHPSSSPPPPSIDSPLTSANHLPMTATTDSIAELFRAANEVGKLTADEKRRLIERGVRTIRELRIETGIRPSSSGTDALLATQIDALQAEARSEEEIKAVLLDLADMIWTLKIVRECESGSVEGRSISVTEIAESGIRIAKCGMPLAPPSPVAFLEARSTVRWP
jgi:hypothetical protein